MRKISPSVNPPLGSFREYTNFILTDSLILCINSEQCSSSGHSSSGGSSSFPHDIKTQSGLTSLYNSRVVSSQVVERPLASSGGSGGSFGSVRVGVANAAGVKTSMSGKSNCATHSGVVVTTSDNKQYLVHKGSGYGKTSQTVVTDAKHMSSNWKPVGQSKNVAGKATVSDYVKAGGSSYALKGGNCHDATTNMKKL